MKLNITYFTNKGNRKNNEDSLLVDNLIISNEDMKEIKTFSISLSNNIFVVVDGMGGYEKGEVASKFILLQLQKNIQNDIELTLQTIQKELDNFSNKNPQFKEMGAVLAGIYFCDEKIIIFNVGDSRVYQLNFGFLDQLSKDHSLVYSLYENGKLEYDEIQNHPKKNIVTSAFIPNQNISIYQKELSLKNQEFFICSDGVWENFKLDELEEILNEKNFDKLINKIWENGANDNFSFIYIKVEK